MAVITLKNFTFVHILDWEESASRTIAKKRIIGKIIPTPEAEAFVSTPKEYIIRARVNDTEKASLWSLYNEAAWQELSEDGSLLDYVWFEKPIITWDSNLGWDDDSRPYIATLGLIVSGT